MEAAAEPAGRRGNIGNVVLVVSKLGSGGFGPCGSFLALALLLM